jgi:Anti-sigma factor NepR
MQQTNFKWAKQVSNSLNFSQEQVTFILGHSLRSLYDDVLAAELPDRLKALVEQLGNRHSPPSDAC